MTNAAAGHFRDFQDRAIPFVTGRQPAHARARLDAIERVLERAFLIPGLNRPIGLDAIIGFVPVAGDVVSGAIGLYLVWEARNLRLSRWTMLRMSANVVFDTALGAIPVAGNVFDVFFRSNSRNIRLIKRHLDRVHPASAILEAQPIR